MPKKGSSHGWPQIPVDRKYLTEDRKFWLTALPQSYLETWSWQKGFFFFFSFRSIQKIWKVVMSLLQTLSPWLMSCLILDISLWLDSLMLGHLVATPWTALMKLFPDKISFLLGVLSLRPTLEFTHFPTNMCLSKISGWLSFFYSSSWEQDFYPKPQNLVLGP